MEARGNELFGGLEAAPEEEVYHFPGTEIDGYLCVSTSGARWLLG
jgi:hypothetical protein